ncbi:uncharacterized protein RCC_07009 [Ramularia collo-cygni]|uniref:Aminodeoxychorismate lyase n=1 Tax=Ramularia collo-cygni TaxID=112498 RepID=A0A2D3V041_9PEZI|nr:uncharacterized protein RCC_07009 [Ramularia collo-cygni]CZT21148.1 uncharacterized protein RCC_07009 [Ramularia collo-cygni]
MSGHFNEHTPGAATPEDEREPYVYTSIRYDVRLLKCEQNTAASCNKPCPFYMLEHHWTRLQIAKWSTFFFADDRPRPNSGGPSIIFQSLLNAVKQWHEAHPGENPEALRIKIRAYVGGKFRTETYYPLKSIPIDSLFPPSLKVFPPEHKADWTIVLDSEPTQPAESTMFKTNDRSVYGRSRIDAGITSFAQPKEVLLFTPDRYVLDGSICTPYLFRNGQWVTPESSAGGLQGTTRRWALEQKLCVEGMIPIDSLQAGETVWLSNGVRGFFWARYESRNNASERAA